MRIAHQVREDRSSNDTQKKRRGVDFRHKTLADLSPFVTYGCNVLSFMHVAPRLNRQC